MKLENPSPLNRPARHAAGPLDGALESGFPHVAFVKPPIFGLVKRRWRYDNRRGRVRLL
jgi:hypothetical protein